jgi:hypothetical protein
MGGITSMVNGNMMPHPPSILASLILVTFVGVGDLPKWWLHSTFRVQCQAVFNALCWLKTNNHKYYGNVEINTNALNCLPDDDVQHEILGIVHQSSDTGALDEESAGYVPINEEHGGMEMYILWSLIFSTS